MDEKKNPNPQAQQAQQGQQSQAWAPNTLYHVGDRRRDASGGNYKCAVGHTSGSGTMEQDRNAHSDWWIAV